MSPNNNMFYLCFNLMSVTFIGLGSRVIVDKQKRYLRLALVRNSSASFALDSG
jgi:hypothetical protein